MTKSQQPILLAGPTASGKTGMAIALAKQCNGLIVNADALQVYKDWHVLTARPTQAEQGEAQHVMFGHIDNSKPYSVGIWLREIKQIMQNSDRRLIIVGGTGLYFKALTKGLVDIPQIPNDIRNLGNEMYKSKGLDHFKNDLLLFDIKSLNEIDANNPARVQRAWEVWKSTGKLLSDWHKMTPAPLIPEGSAVKLCLNWPAEKLNERIDRRFDQMVKSGAIKECERLIAKGYDPSLPSAKALGAKEIIEAIYGNITMEDAVIASKILTHRFAKRQRTWFRSQMKNWHQIDMTQKVDLTNLLMNLDS